VAERERARLEARLEGRMRELVGKRGEVRIREREEELQIEDGQGGAMLNGGEQLRTYEEQIAEGKGGAWLGGEERIAETRAGKAWVEETEVNIEAMEATTSENGDAEDSSSEQVNSPTTENASKEGSGNGKIKRKNRRGNRGRKMSKGFGSKKKNKIEDATPTVETPEPVEGKENSNPANPTTKPGIQHKAGVEVAASLLSHMAIDPLVRASKVGTLKEPISDVWPLFKASPVYNPAGGGIGMNAMFASLQRPGQATVLGAATGVWAGDEHLRPEGRRNPVTNDHRAAWPEMNELKTEGQYRKEAGKDRRLPIPRMDMMTKEAIIRAVGGQEKIDEMTQEEVDHVCREQAKKTGDQIPWMDRQPIRFDGIDRLESVNKQLREENERRRKEEPICGPRHHSAAQGVKGEQQRQRRGTNTRLRGGYNRPGTPRRQDGRPPPVQQKLIDPEAMSYGADGLGDGMTPQPGGWVFDEEYLRQKGDWEDLLENQL
jgi:hypothetical protein